MILSNMRFNKGTDQTKRMRRLVCAFVVRKRPKTDFLVRGPNVIHQNLLTKFEHSMKMYNLRLNIHRFNFL